MAGKKKKKLDPLFQLFEHYLLNRSYEDSAAFTKEVAEEYLSYLDSTTAHVPFHARKGLIEDLQGETHELLVKKMYGVVRSTDYQNFGSVIKVEKGLRAFDFRPPSPTPEDPNRRNLNDEDPFKEEGPSVFQKTGSRAR